MEVSPPTGPLAGLRVVEMSGLGPGPFAAALLADLGADVLSLRRPGPDPAEAMSGTAVERRGRPELVVDLKAPSGRAAVLRLSESAEVLLEGFRPGVMERLELGPEALLARNPALVYGRITGYGQDGPLSRVAGHDINYIAIAGVLDGFRRVGGRPQMPANLLGDYGGGGMLLALGVLAAVLHARSSGIGQVIDAAMVDGVAQLSGLLHGLRSAGAWGPPGTNFLDSGAPFYEVYETADKRHVAVGAIEPQFYAELLRLLGIDAADAPQWDRAAWPQIKERIASVVRTRTRDEWTSIFEYAEACVTPVLALEEAPRHPHNVARGTFAQLGDAVLPAPAPRFSETPARHSQASSVNDLLSAWGVRREELVGGVDPTTP